MATDVIAPPPGFVLDDAEAEPSNSLPEGFVMDSAPSPPDGFVADRPSSTATATSPPSIAKTAASTFASNVGPGTAFMAAAPSGAKAGAKIGAKIGAATGEILGLGPEDPAADVAGGVLGAAGGVIGAFIGGLASGGVASWAAYKAQHAALNKIAPTFTKNMDNLLASGAEAHPFVAVAASVAANLPGAELKIPTLAQIPFRAALGAATGAVLPLAEGRKRTASEVAMDAAAGAGNFVLFGRSRFERTPAPKIVPDETEPTATGEEPPVDFLPEEEAPSPISQVNLTGLKSKPNPVLVQSGLDKIANGEEPTAEELTAVQQNRKISRDMAERMRVELSAKQPAAPVNPPTSVEAIPEHQQLLDEESNNLDVPVAPATPDDIQSLIDSPDQYASSMGKTLQGSIATVDRKNGRIVVNDSILKDWLGNIPQGLRPTAMRSILQHERIHLATSDEDALAYLKTLTPLEQSIGRRIYTGKWGVQNSPDVNDTLLGHDMIRFQLERAAKMTPQEYVESVGIDKLKLQSLAALQDIVGGIRKTIGTSASREGTAILDKIQNSLRLGILERGGASPAALNKEVKDRMIKDADDLDSDAQKYEDAGDGESAESLRAMAKTNRQKASEDFFPAARPKKRQESELQAGFILPGMETVKLPGSTEAAPKMSYSQTGEVQLAPSAPEVSAEEQAAQEANIESKMPPKLNAAQIQAAGNDWIRNTLETSAGNTTLPEPKFKDFVRYMNQGRHRIQPGQVSELWQQGVGKWLENAKGEELAALSKNLFGGDSIFARSRLVDKPAEGFQLESVPDRTAAQRYQDERQMVRRNQYRDRVIGALYKKLVQPMTKEETLPATRKTVTPSEIRYGGGKQISSYQNFDAASQVEPRLGEMLTDEARRSNADSSSLTKRLTVLQEKRSGKLDMVSTYKHPSRGTVLLDPLSPQGEHTPLESILRRYRVLHSILLDEPVKKFRQSFKDLNDYNEKFGNEARSNYAQETSYDPRSVPIHEFLEATEGRIEGGEEGMFQGPHKDLITEARGSSMEQSRFSPISDVEASALQNHFEEEYGREPQSPDEVETSLYEMAQNERIKPAALSALTKVARQVQEDYPELSASEQVTKLAQRIYEDKNLENTIARSQKEAAAKADEDVEAEIPGRAQAARPSNLGGDIFPAARRKKYGRNSYEDTELPLIAGFHREENGADSMAIYYLRSVGSQDPQMALEYMKTIAESGVDKHSPITQESAYGLIKKELIKAMDFQESESVQASESVALDDARKAFSEMSKDGKLSFFVAAARRAKFEREGLDKGKQINQGQLFPAALRKPKTQDDFKAGARSLSESLFKIITGREADQEELFPEADRIKKTVWTIPEWEKDRVMHKLDEIFTLGHSAIRLSPNGQKAFDVAAAIMHNNRLLASEAKQLIPSFHPSNEEIWPRMAKDPNSIFARFERGTKRSLAEGFFKKTSWFTQHRRIKALIDDSGRRQVAVMAGNGKNGKMVAYTNGKGQDLGPFKHSDILKREELYEQEIEPVAKEIESLLNEKSILTRTDARAATAVRRLKNIDRRLQELEDDRQEINSRYPVDDLKDKVWSDKNGKQWKIAEATMGEIERNMDVRYYKDPFSVLLTQRLNLQNMIREARWMEDFKTTPQFARISRPAGESNNPPDWKPTSLPALRGYVFEPHLADTLDQFNERSKGKDANSLTGANRLLMTAVFFDNPFLHTPNLLSWWFTTRGALAWVDPRAYARLIKTFPQAFNDVSQKTPAYVAALRNGTPLQYTRSRNLSETIVSMVRKQLDQEPTLAKKLSNVLGYANPIKLSQSIGHAATSGLHDILTMQLLHELRLKDPKLSPEEAIRKVSAIMPDYRIPARVLDVLPDQGKTARAFSKLIANPNAIWFGAYHYSEGKAFSNLAKGAALGEGMTRGEALDKIAATALLMVAAYPILDSIVQEITGRKDLKFRRAGSTTWPSAIESVVKGERTPAQVTPSFLSPSQATTAAISLLFNKNLVNMRGTPIYNPKTGVAQGAKDVGAFAARSLAPVSLWSDLTTGRTDWQEAALRLTGVAHDYSQEPGAKVLNMAYDWAKKTGNQNLLDQFNERAMEIYPPSQYSTLKNFLARGDVRSARVEIQRLKQSGKTSAEIGRELNPSKHPMSGLKATDEPFYESLTPQQKMIYDQAQANREKVYENYQKIE